MLHPSGKNRLKALLLIKNFFTSLWLGLIAILTNFTMTASAQAEETVRFLVPSYSANTEAYFESAARSFEQANPDIKIAISMTSWGKLQSDILQATPDQLPDAALTSSRWTAELTKKNLLEPLDGRMTVAYRSRFLPRYLAQSVLAEKTYGLPATASTRALYYNSDMFAKAGYSTPPPQWKGFTAAAQKLKEQGFIAFGLQGKDVETEIYYYYALWSYGGDVVMAGKSGLSSPQALKAAKLYMNFITKGYTQAQVTNYNRDDLETLFKQGKIASLITTPTLINQLAKEAPGLKYGIAPIPVGKKGATGAYLITDNYVLFHNSAHQDAAWKFITFLSSDEQRQKFDNLEGYLPVTVAGENDPHFAKNEKLIFFRSQVDKAHLSPSVANWEGLAGTAMQALITIYQGADMSATLTDAAAKINQVALSKN